MSSGMQGGDLLYNVMIIRTYLEYLEKYYPEVSTDDILEEIGMTRRQIEDGGLWYSQEVSDLFHGILNRKTRNPMVARDAGRYVVTSRAYRVLREYIYGFIRLEGAYSLLPKIYAKVSRGASLSVRKTGAGLIEVTAEPAPGVREKKYQCENRIG